MNNPSWPPLTQVEIRRWRRGLLGIIAATALLTSTLGRLQRHQEQQLATRQLLRLTEHPETRIDLNQASRDTLQLLPGIGQRRAELIIARREWIGPFPTSGALSEIPGLSHNLVLKLGRHIRTGEQTP